MENDECVIIPEVTTTVKKRQNLPLVIASITRLAKKCGCSLSHDVKSYLVASVPNLVTYIVQQKRMYRISPDLVHKLGGGITHIQINEPWFGEFLGSLDVPRHERGIYASSTAAALTTAVANACFATKIMRKTSKSPIVQPHVVENFVNCFL